MSKKKQPQTVFEKYQAIQKIGTEVEIPFNEVSRIVFGCGSKQLHIFGDQICLGYEGDYESLDNCRNAIAWYVEQLGGEVKWKAE